MSGSDLAFEDFLQQQRLVYQRALPEKMAQLDALWRAGASGADAASLQAMARLAHSLAGTAGTLGFGPIGLAAGELEGLLAPATEAGLTPLRHDHIATAMAGLQASVRACMERP